jgi:hypothetical protein
MLQYLPSRYLSLFDVQYIETGSSSRENENTEYSKLEYGCVASSRGMKYLIRLIRSMLLWDSRGDEDRGARNVVWSARHPRIPDHVSMGAMSGLHFLAR